MTKQEYMKKLKKLLPEKDKKDILLDYEEHFLTGINEGKSEEEIAEELGSPEEVVKEYTTEPAEKKSITTIIFGAIGIILFDIFVGISLLASLFSVWIALWAVVLALVITAVALIFSTVASFLIPSIPWYVLLFSGISLLGLSVIAGIGMIYVTKWFYLAIKWYVELHIKIFTNK